MIQINLAIKNSKILSYLKSSTLEKLEERASKYFKKIEIKGKGLVSKIFKFHSILFYLNENESCNNTNAKANV